MNKTVQSNQQQVENPECRHCGSENLQFNSRSRTYSIIRDPYMVVWENVTYGCVDCKEVTIFEDQKREVK